MLEQDLKEPTKEPTVDFGAEFQNWLKHLGLWFDAVFEDSYHLFLKNLPDTEFMLRVQSPISLFVVWETRPPSNTILSKIAKLLTDVFKYSNNSFNNFQAPFSSEGI
jgi:hypothetical protein